MRLDDRHSCISSSFLSFYPVNVPKACSVFRPVIVARFVIANARVRWRKMEPVLQIIFCDTLHKNNSTAERNRNEMTKDDVVTQRDGPDHQHCRSDEQTGVSQAMNSKECQD